jgi:hypothetical protein
MAVREEGAALLRESGYSLRPKEVAKSSKEW